MPKKIPKNTDKKIASKKPKPINKINDLNKSFKSKSDRKKNQEASILGLKENFLEPPPLKNKKSKKTFSLSSPTTTSGEQNYSPQEHVEKDFLLDLSQDGKPQKISKKQNQEEAVLVPRSPKKKALKIESNPGKQIKNKNSALFTNKTESESITSGKKKSRRNHSDLLVSENSTHMQSQNPNEPFVDKDKIYVSGEVQGNRNGTGCIFSEDKLENLYLPVSEMIKVLHGDYVLAQFVGYDSKGRKEANIVRLIHRPHSVLVGRLLETKNGYRMSPEDLRIRHSIRIETKSVELFGAQDGQVVLIQLEDSLELGQPWKGRIVNILGQISDPGMEVEIAVQKFHIPNVFDQTVLEETKLLPEDLSEKDLASRVDLRDIPLITIDGVDAKDFDDAVYCEQISWPVKSKNDFGNNEHILNYLAPKGKPFIPEEIEAFRLIVAIADVSHYVQPSTPLDLAARGRSTSVYFPRKVIPMLPEKLSNDLCSLHPQADRLSLVCDLIIDCDGCIHAYQFYEAVIRSEARFTYEEIQEHFLKLKLSSNPQAKNSKETQSLFRGVDARSNPALTKEPVKQSIKALFKVYKALLRHRKKRGAIELDTNETRMIFDSLGRIESIVPSIRHDAHKLIEECMLAANVCAADFLRRSQQPFLYRIHPPPTAEKTARLKEFLAGINLILTGGKNPTPNCYAELIRLVKSRNQELAPIVQGMLLRSLQQAVYSPDNVGHFGLAYQAYTHFTSPIRRYSDLLTHRVIKAILGSKTPFVPALLPYHHDKKFPSLTNHKTLNQNKDIGARNEGPINLNQSASQKEDHSYLQQIEGLGSPFFRSSWEIAKSSTSVLERSKTNSSDSTIDSSDSLKTWRQLGELCSSNERRADEASRDVEAWLKCWYMREQLGTECLAYVTGVTSFGLFVTLKQWQVEGLVHISELGNDYFHYDETKQELRGEHSGTIFRLADHLSVRIVRIDIEARRIDLQWIPPEGSASASKSKNRKKK